MITRKQLKSKTGYDSFLTFKRNCIRSSESMKTQGFTEYLYDNRKTVELDIKPEELFMAADDEIKRRRKTKPAKKEN